MWKSCTNLLSSTGSVDWYTTISWWFVGGNQLFQFHGCTYFWKYFSSFMQNFFYCCLLSDNNILYKFRSLYSFYYFQLLLCIIWLGCEEQFSTNYFLQKIYYFYFQMCLYMGHFYFYLLLEKLQCSKNCCGWVNPSFRHWNRIYVFKWEYSEKSHAMA